MTAQIEQNPSKLSELCLVCPELGIGYSNPAFIGDDRFIRMLDELNSIECNTGFGEFTLRKREGKRWIAEKRIGEKVIQVTLGATQRITSAELDNAAIRIYSNSADK